MIRDVDLWARRLIAWPLVLIGYGMTCTASLFIKAGMWLIDVDASDIERIDPGDL